MKAFALWSCLLAADAASAPPKRMRTTPLASAREDERPQRPLFGGRSLQKQTLPPPTASPRLGFLVETETAVVALDELSMSAPAPLEAHEVGSNDVAVAETRGIELSLSMMVDSEETQFMMVDLEELGSFSLPTKAPSHSSSSLPTSMGSELLQVDHIIDNLLDFSSLSMSLSLPTDMPTTPWPSYVPTKAPSVSQPLSHDDFPLHQNDFVVPTPAPTAKGQETAAPTKSKAAKTKAPANKATEGPSGAPTGGSTAALALMSMSLSMSMSMPESSPTDAPTESPFSRFAVEIDLATRVRLQLVDMSGVMDVAAENVFEQSCGAFLEGNLAAYDPPIYGVECAVTGQEVDAARRLAKSEGSRIRGGRKLQTAPLYVDVDVTGRVAATSAVSQASDVPFDALVSNSFNVYSSTFVGQLMADGAAASIDDFDDLSAVYAIQPVDGGDGSGGDSSAATNPDGSGNSEGGGESNTNAMLVVAIMISICGVALLGLFAGYFYHVHRRRKAGPVDDALSEGSDPEVVDVYHESLVKRSFETEPKRSFESQPGSTTYNLGVIAQNSTMGRSEDKDALSYQYSLDDGLASPRSYSQPGASPVSASTTSLTDRFANQMTNFVDGGAPHRIRKEIVAPKGKLGIIIDTCSDGPIVHSVKPTSPLDGLIFKGDLVVAVDGEDTQEWSAHYLTKLVAKKSREERRFTVLRTVAEGMEEEQQQQQQQLQQQDEEGGMTVVAESTEQEEEREKGEEGSAVMEGIDEGEKEDTSLEETTDGYSYAEEGTSSLEETSLEATSLPRDGTNSMRSDC